MYLVEYVKILKKQNVKFCSCFYSADDALYFSKKLANHPSIKSVELSCIDFTKVKILYQKEKIFY